MESKSMDVEHNTKVSSYDYDLVVIGGGSGGLAAAKEAARLAPTRKIVCFDYVEPTQHGTKWGLGGTCVNVGCIPKKLMHHAGNIGGMVHTYAEQFGWESLKKGEHNWPTMIQTITDYIRSLNFSYRTSLRTAGVKYFDSKASFIDDHTIKYDGKQSGTLTFERAIIAVGGRPSLGEFPGAELAISSDDIFWMSKPPGKKLLLIGASYIALECASFLHHLGFDVSVLVRSVPLRKMDQQSAQMIGELMERDGIRFISPASPVRLVKLGKAQNAPSNGKEVRPGVWEVASDSVKHRMFVHASGSIELIDVESGSRQWRIPDGPIEATYKYESNGQLHTENFDCVLSAIGRKANVAGLNLEKAGVRTLLGKILVDAAERTTASHIYAIGDNSIGIPTHTSVVNGNHKADSYLEEIALDRPELTPVAIKSGILLAQRLFGNCKQLMQYKFIPTAVFTSPSEYAFVGLSEEQANYSPEDGGIGAENVEVYHSRFGNIEISPLHVDLPKLRSNSFTLRNMWARQYAEQKGLDWADVSFDTEMRAYVTVGKNDGTRVNATVVDRYPNDRGQMRYRIKLEDGTERGDVSGTELDLQDYYQDDDNQVFYKANCLAKLIVDKRNDAVVGLHFVGPNAGEVVQGFALAVQIGATRKDFENLVGIHPIAAEEFAVLEVTKSSGRSPLKKAGCGGGSCG